MTGDDLVIISVGLWWLETT